MVAQTHTPGSHQGATHYRRSKGHPVLPHHRNKTEMPPSQGSRYSYSVCSHFLPEQNAWQAVRDAVLMRAPTGGQASAHCLPPGDSTHLQRDS